ncbi:hypothetical protein CH337_11275 [Rhodoblastus acidophilus]|nr:hypothetical protein CKO16_09790 [Rhodoblastus acidophilus]RAI19799.1 hypothetical protein CH337_11275 [Rhodoblastus acidophilus]
MAEALAEVATELRMVNVIDLIGYVHGHRDANLEDLIHSSAELYFKQGALRYACAAEADVQWHAPPRVSLGMEFRWRGATALFRLQLDASRAAIDIHHLTLDTPGAPEDVPMRFASALADARLRPAVRAARA